MVVVQETELIYEIATIVVHATMHDAFLAGARQAVPLFQRAHGCVSFELQRVIESPDTYRLYVGWETLEDHVDRFRASDDFQTWRGLVGSTFAEPPSVVHVESLLKPF